MAGHARLGDAEDAGELRDVEPVAAQNAQQPQPRLVPQQPEQRGGLTHIYKSTLSDSQKATRSAAMPPAFRVAEVDGARAGALGGFHLEADRWAQVGEA